MGKGPEWGLSTWGQNGKMPLGGSRGPGPRRRHQVRGCSWEDICSPLGEVGLFRSTWWSGGLKIQSCDF